MFLHSVPVDYDAVIDHILQSVDKDDPALSLSFEQARKLLEEQAFAMLDLDEDAVEDVELTHILLEHYVTGSIDRITVTDVPGVVIKREDRWYKLPLVRIQLTY